MKGSPISRRRVQDGSDAAKDGGQPIDATAQEKGDDLDWGWGAVVNLHKRAASKAGELAKYEVEVLVMCKVGDHHQGEQRIEPPTPTVNGGQVVVLAYCVVFSLRQRAVLILVRFSAVQNLTSYVICRSSTKKVVN